MLASVRPDSKSGYNLHLVLESEEEESLFKAMPKFTVEKSIEGDRLILRQTNSGKPSQVRTKGDRTIIQKRFTQKEESAIAFNMTSVNWHATNAYKGAIIILPKSPNHQRVLHRQPKDISTLIKHINRLVSMSEGRIELVVEDGKLIAYHTTRTRIA
jgi:hypothetical protein